MFNFEKARTAISRDSKWVKTDLEESHKKELTDFSDGLFMGFEEEEFDIESNFEDQNIQIYLASDYSISAMESSFESKWKPKRNEMVLHRIIENNYRFRTKIVKIITVDREMIARIELNAKETFLFIDYEEGKEVGINIAKYFNLLKAGLNKEVFEALVLFVKNNKGPMIFSPKFILSENFILQLEYRLLLKDSIWCRLKFDLRQNISSNPYLSFNYETSGMKILLDQEKLIQLSEGKSPIFFNSDGSIFLIDD